MNEWTVTLSVNVEDAAQLFDSARTAAAGWGADDAEITDELGARDAPDVAGCLRRVFDPGPLQGSDFGVSLNDCTAEPVRSTVERP